MKSQPVLLPRLEKLMLQFGEQIKLARLRRDLSMEQVSERSGISRSTLSKIEKGASSVSMASYVQVLFVLGLDNDLLLVAKDDTLGRKLQDLKLVLPKRSSKKNEGNV
jgi:transcriptional regulator with XRE-family HTH domain